MANGRLRKSDIDNLGGVSPILYDTSPFCEPMMDVSPGAFKTYQDVFFFHRRWDDVKSPLAECQEGWEIENRKFCIAQWLKQYLVVNYPRIVLVG